MNIEIGNVYLSKLHGLIIFNLGRICTDIQPLDDGILSRIFRFGRSSDEMHSRAKRQSEADGDIFDNAQIICEV